MNLKKLVFISIAFLIPLKGYTLGFGSIHVNSKLNEPLNLEFSLVDSKGINVDDIIIRNASKSTYKKVDLPLPGGFNRVKFTPTKKADGSIVVKISSKKPYRELYVTFIADLHWKDTQLNREYTFFLDPPNLVTPNLNTPNLKKKAQPTKQIKTQALAKKTPSRSLPKAKVIQGNSYLVKRGDSLIRIARRSRPDKSVTTYQTMNALFALNPKAFINNNIDLLKQGYTLTLPNAQEVQQLNKQNVQKSQTPQKKQTKVLKQKIKPAKANKEPITTDNETINKPEPETETESKNSSTPRLKIIPPSEELLNKPIDDDVLELMTKTLKTSHETISLLKKENSLLSVRIESLTKRLGNYDERNKQLSDKIDKITTLLEQQKPEQQKQQTNIVPIVSGTANEAKKENIQPDEKTTPLAITVAAPAIKKESNLASMLQNILSLQNSLIIIAVILLFSIIVIMRKRANKKEQADIDNIQAENTAQHHAQQNSDSTTASFSEYFDKSSIKVEETSDSGTSTSHEEFADASEIELDLDLEQDKDDSISTVEKSQTIEATFRELNTFIAYGKHDSAEQLLRDELAKTPAEIRLHIRLFELFAETNRSDDYKQHLVSISQLTDSDADFLQHIEQLYLDTWNQPLKATF